MLVGIVGGKLQGVEAAYLARKAGWEVRIVDRSPAVPACGLADSFVRFDVTVENSLADVLGDVDFLIPALEDNHALRCLAQWSRKTGIPLAFDPPAYAVSSSKLKSAELFTEIGIPLPVPWPHCGYPVLAKPARRSGSKGVGLFRDLDSLKKRFPLQFPPPDWVLEEFLDGSQHSLEVVGRPGNYRVLQVTDLDVDHKFDCKRVVAPSRLPPNLITEFENMSLAIAAALNLNGIMDVEVIHSRKGLKVLEIDARLPSQTPTAVYWSTRQNMLEILRDLYTAPQAGTLPVRDIARGVVYEHVLVSANTLEIRGEGIMAEGGPLRLQENFFGADEALTNFEPGRKTWVATLILCETDRRRAWKKRNRTIVEITQSLGIKEVVDHHSPG